MNEPVSASQLGELLGDRVPHVSTLSSAALTLTDSVRRLLDMAVRTDVDDEARRAAADAIDAVTAALALKQRQPLIALVRHDDGRLENLTQAGAGRLNPRAPKLTFEPHPVAERGAFEPVEVTAHCTLDASFSGPPERAHGGAVATLFDEVLGVAATAAGATGMTAGLEVRYRGGTPLGVPLRVVAHCVRRDGRKSFASGELMSGDVVVAEATAVFVGPRVNSG